MPTICCAVGCKHTSGNGICRLKRFPSDAKRSIVWEKNLRRNHWVRKDWELLCECHFHFSQFEKLREDGAKKLKHNAVPTLFPTHTLTLPEVSGSHLSSLEGYTYPEVRIVNTSTGILESLVPVEVHFEESAFESHRADGLKKLKPNAVPTIHSVSTSSKKQRKQNVKARVEFTIGGNDKESFVLPENLSSKSKEGVPIQISEVYCNKLEGTQRKPERRKRIKTLHVTEIISNGLPAKVTDNKELRESIKLCSAVNDSENHVNQAVKNEMLHGINSPEAAEENLTVDCFICSRVIKASHGVCLSIPTEATRILLVRRLEIIANFEGVVGSQEMVCSRCASLLNHVDRTEAELSVLKGAIAACARGRNLDGKLESDPEYANNVQLLDIFESLNDGRHNILSLDELFLIQGENEEMTESLLEDRSEEEQLHDGEVEEAFSGVKAETDEEPLEVDVHSEASGTADEPSNECSQLELEITTNASKSVDDSRTSEVSANKIVPCTSITEKSTSYSSTSYDTITNSKTHICKICNFKTPHNCVMIWHLRMHMKESRWCDFCNVSIPEQESIFASMKRSRAPNRLSRKKPNFQSIQPKILPVTSAEPVPSASYPITPYSLTLIPVEDHKASTPVLLISKESESAPDLISSSSAMVDTPKNLEMTAVVDVIVDGGMLESVLVSGEPNMPKDSAKKVQVKMEEHLDDVSCVEEFCRVRDSASERLEVADSVGTLGEEFDVSINECDNLVEGAVMQDFSALPVQGGDIASECVSGSVSGFLDDGSQGSKSDNLHSGEVFCDDSVERSFLDTLSPQREGKFAEILPEICDESGEQNMMAISNDASEGNITNKDVSFARSDGLGESELAIAYENSVAALMCQSDDSDGMLSYH